MPLWTKTILCCVLALGLALAFASCKEHIADNAAANRPPSSFLWLYPDAGAISTGVSKTHLHWWGEDPDGMIRGYLFGFRIAASNAGSSTGLDTLRWTWTTANDSTLLFPLDTLFQRFEVVVRAVDNTFGGLPEKSAVRLSPFPYWDVNRNGVFDGADVRLDALPGAMDPVGARQVFPIRNTPPTVFPLPNPNDPSIPQRLPDTSYTSVTVAFKGTDPDGDNTLTSYRLALNDTSSTTGQWLTVTLRDTIVTLVVPRSRSNSAGSVVTADVYSGSFLGRRLIGQLPNLKLDAENAIYFQARDAAGEYSTPGRLPGAPGDHWFVKRPQGNVLLVSDYLNFDAPLARSTYLSTLGNMSSPPRVDVLDIGYGITIDDKANGKFGKLVPQFVDPALIQTFLLYDYVIWYTDQFPSLLVAQLSLFPYLQNGGRVIFTTMFLTTIDPRGALRDFAPIDSISSVDLSPTRPPVPPAVAGDSRIPANFIAFADSSRPGDIYPQLAFNASPVNHVIFMRPVYRRTDARYIYHLQADSRTPARYLGAPNIAVIDGLNKIVFVGLPLHLLNNPVQGNPRGLSAFFDKAMGQFSPSQVVNRRVF